jgi:hypothetical protein
MLVLTQGTLVVARRLVHLIATMVKALPMLTRDLLETYQTVKPTLITDNHLLLNLDMVSITVISHLPKSDNLLILGNPQQLTTGTQPLNQTPLPKTVTLVQLPTTAATAIITDKVLVV